MRINKERLYNVMASNGIFVKDLCKRLDVPESTVKKLLSCNGDVDKGMVSRIAYVLGVTMMDLEAKDTEFEDVPDGDYIVTIEKMEIKLTKAGDKLMFAVQCKIVEDLQNKHQENRMIFFNRVISGNKNSETWNDGRAIKSVCTWLEKLETETVPEFFNYSDFANVVLDIFQEIHETTEMEVKYSGNGFNPISIKEVFDK